MMTMTMTTVMIMMTTTVTIAIATETVQQCMYVWLVTMVTVTATVTVTAILDDQSDGFFFGSALILRRDDWSRIYIRWFEAVLRTAHGAAT
jgi:hypothetical protein